jgi:putative peptidoglycan binding protein
VTVRWSRPQPKDGAGATGDNRPPKPPAFEFAMDVFVNVDPRGQVVAGAPDGATGAGGSGAGAGGAGDDAQQKRQAAQQRLHNLGFAMGEALEDNVRFFQRELGLDETGKVGDIEAELTQRHAALDPPSRYQGGSQGVKDEPSGPPLLRSDDGPSDDETDA